MAARIRFRGFRALLATREDPYAGIDLASMKRMGFPMMASAVILGAALVLVAPPTAAIGDAGWFVAAAVVCVSAVSAFFLFRPGSTAGFTAALMNVYLGTAGVMVAEWLAGGHDTPYHWLYLSAAIFPPSVHPPRRAIGVVMFASLGVLMPLAYTTPTAMIAADMALQIAFMWMLAVAMMVVMDAVREHTEGLQSDGERAWQMARLDALTGLGNRRAFDEALARAVEHASPERPLSLVVLDLDDFKSINDEFGHQRGDLVLKEVAAAIRSAMRGPDACFRWGGDEFAVLLPNTSAEDAREIAARVQAASPTSVSAGVASLWDGEDAEALLTAADDALRIEKSWA